MNTSRLYIAVSSFAKDSAQPLDMLRQAPGIAFEFNTTGNRLTKSEVIERLKGFDAVLAGLEPYDKEVLGALPQLKCISRCGVGVDNVDLAYARQKNIAVLTTPEVTVQPVAEMTIAMAFDLLRQLSVHTALMRQKKWERRTGSQLAGKKVGVVGLGRIGRKVAELFNRLDAQVYGYDIAPDKTWAQQHQVTLTGFYDLLKESDLVTLHLSPTAEHPFCLGEEDFKRMKKGAMLINVARGSLVDEPALVSALNSGHLAGAGIDVFSAEPYAGPLCDLPQVILTPHVSSLTHESRPVMEAAAVTNVLNFLGMLKK